MFRSWSKKMRQQDYSLQWIISAGKESADAAGTHLLELSLNDTIIQSELSVTKSVEDQSSVNEEFNNILGIESDTTSGTVFRGLYTLDTPVASSDSANFNLADKYRLIVKNTGTASIVVTLMYVTLKKIYPGESFESPESHDADTSAEDLAKFQVTYTEVADPTSQFYVLRNVTDLISPSFSRELYSLFSGLSNSSTLAELNSVINNPIFVNYYKNVFPISPIWPRGRTGTIDESNVLTPVKLPVTLQPYEHIAFAFGRHVSDHFYNPLDLTRYRAQ